MIIQLISLTLEADQDFTPTTLGFVGHHLLADSDPEIYPGIFHVIA